MGAAIGDTVDAGDGEEVGTVAGVPRARKVAVEKGDAVATSGVGAPAVAAADGTAARVAAVLGTFDATGEAPATVGDAVALADADDDANGDVDAKGTADDAARVRAGAEARDGRVRDGRRGVGDGVTVALPFPATGERVVRLPGDRDADSTAVGRGISDGADTLAAAAADGERDSTTVGRGVGAADPPAGVGDAAAAAAAAADGVAETVTAGRTTTSRGGGGSSGAGGGGGTSSGTTPAAAPRGAAAAAPPPPGTTAGALTGYV